MNRDEKSGRVGIEVVVVLVVGAGVGVGVDYCGKGVIGGIVRGMVGAAAVEVSEITVTVKKSTTLVENLRSGNFEVLES
ncbi:hypothetical protein Tco_0408874 [Tanacetum coccineum]